MNEEMDLPSGWALTALPEGWCWATVEQVSYFVRYGSSAKTSEDSSGIPVLRMGNIQAGILDTAVLKYLPTNHQEFPDLLLEPGDLLFNRTNSAELVGKSAVYHGSPAPCSYASYLICVRLADGCSSDYLCYFLNSSYGRTWVASVVSQQVGQANVNGTKLQALRFPLPPLVEQQRIVAAIEQQFTRLDAGVAALRSVQTRLKRYRAAVLKAALEGKLTEAWRAEHPETEPASVLLQRILAERRARWEADLRAKGKDPAKVRYEEPAGPDTTDLPELPEGWCWATVEQLGDTNEQAVLTGPFGSNLGREDFIDSGVPVLTIGCLTNQGLSLDKAFYVSAAKASELERYRVKAGDMLFSRMASVGRAEMVSEKYEGALINYHLMRLRLTDQAINPHFFVSYVRGSGTVADYVREVNHGATRDGINTSQLLNLPLSLSPRAEQEQIVAEVERRLSVVGELETTVEANLKRAERLRQSILREAFAGRLVSQDPNDEPVSVLLERIRQERETLAANNNRSDLPSKHGKRNEKQEISAQAIALDIVLDQEIGQVHSIAQQISLWDKDPGKDE